MQRSSRVDVGWVGWRRVAWVVPLALMLGGCSALRAIVDQSERVEAAGTLQGTVVTEGVPRDDVIVGLLRRTGATQLAVYRLVAPARDGSFSVAVPEGEFYVGAFVDENHDGHFQPGEPGQFHGKPSFVAVRAQETVNLSLRLTPTSRPTSLDHSVDGVQQPEVGGSTGTVTTLDDARFDPENGLLGMWRPFDFMSGPQGGLFMLGEYDPGRIPVLFVHGIAGTPRDFARTIAGLDLQRYQPWVVYYPSGLRLDMIGNAIASSMHQMQRRHDFRQFAVVAHSMGGLVARSYLQKAFERYPDEAQALRVFVTVNSPLGGMDSAALAVEKSPVVVPSWQDVATGSEFLDRLQRSAWHSDVPYYLVFSFDGDENGDGTVPLASQLPTAFQAQARRLFGFQGTHVGTLSDPAFVKQLNQLLDASMTTAGTGTGTAGR